MNKNQLAAALRSEISDDEVILAALTCPDCGRERVPFDRAVELAAQANSLEEWYGLLNAFEDMPSPRLLPSPTEVRTSCRALAATARERQRSKN